MLKRSHRDIDLPSLVPPQFCAASDVKKHESSLKRSAAWDSALMSAYIVESEVPKGPTAGLGMGFEIMNPSASGSSTSSEPRWNGSWSSHPQYMRFLFGEDQRHQHTQQQGAVAVDTVGVHGSHAVDAAAANLNTNNNKLREAASAVAKQKALAQAADPPEAPPPTAKRRRFVEEDKEDDDVAERLGSPEAPEVRQGAREFAQRTTLRRGFFASALKRQLEALREENRQLKRLAVEVLDDRARRDLFADLGTEQSCVVADPPAVEAAQQGAVEAAQQDADARADVAALAKVVQTTRRVVATTEHDVTRRDLTLVKVVQQAQRAFVVTNPALPDNPIVWSSDEFTKLTGYDRSEVCGRNCRFLQGPKTNPKTVDAVRHAIGESHEASVVLLNYRKDGSTFWNRFFIAPLHDSKGQVTFFVGVQTDAPRRAAPRRAWGDAQHFFEEGQAPKRREN
ncbi:hypothetical protein CTAYLR_001273 [Chrysophaeum taylorii]|uniref:LOV domain-containing protein n=1 Tax=Chrysophaeum taylorii TaxID=2483200 RepID=A0AAD7XNP4_9STRA|nr:hypothetical protein CTAYLR_001273 [Chrysophaeum taylorii]